MPRARYNFTASELMPDYWDVPVGSLEDIVFLGQVTIRQMARSWRSSARDLRWFIRKVDGECKFLEGKNAASIWAVAQEYLDPEFSIGQIGLRGDNNWSDDLEPLDEESKNRKAGATTFNRCGWCKYASGGICRYQYHITTHCSFLSHVGVHDAEMVFLTPCFLKLAGDETFDLLRSRLSEKRDQLIEQKRQTDAKIRLLLRLEKKAERKPALPEHRPYDWFNIGDPVICFIGGWKERLTSDLFATAKVIDGYRHHDGCVSVRYDKRVHGGEYLDGHGGGYGMGRPEIMHKWEFQYLLDYPEFGGVFTWLGVSSYLEGYDVGQLQSALARAATTRGRKQLRVMARRLRFRP